MYEDRAYGCLELMKDTSVYSYPLCSIYGRVNNSNGTREQCFVI